MNWNRSVITYGLNISHLPATKSLPTKYALSRIKSQDSVICKRYRSGLPRFDFVDGDMDLAFTLVIHKDPIQVARLLRMIYRPQNYYCIHIDKRAKKEFVNEIEGLAKCLGPNVRLVPPEQRIAVVWGDESVMKPQILCAKKALKEHTTWKYLVNAVGQEFPIRTNLELIAAIKALNGSNLIEGDGRRMWLKRTKNETLPLNASWIKGSIYGAYKREFLAKVILEKSQSVSTITDFIMKPKHFKNPDEFYFPTLAYNPKFNLPGSCLKSPAPEAEVGFGYLGRYVIFQEYHMKCPTKSVRSVCILGKHHIPFIKSSPALFANKFHADYEREAYDELESWYFAKIREEMVIGNYSKLNFDPAPYSQVTCSKHHI